eukprot:TRINITY_DN199_c0_g1_i3.p1 TRINITY_DN199_c0_g1~~TRINITY_DN199_c0_g1_i3.p1  ORF type:complete len:165 (-),score=50.83 TRINITY_DN199_c0_g1_i3:23-517(-)
MCTESLLKVIVIVFAVLTGILTYQFWHYVAIELSKTNTDGAFVLFFIVSFIITFAMCCLAVYSSIKVNIKLILFCGIMFIIQSLILLLQIILFAIAAKGCEADSFLDELVGCGNSAGALFVPLVLITITTGVLGVALMLLWSTVKDDDGDDDDNTDKSKRGNYY